MNHRLRESAYSSDEADDRQSRYSPPTRADDILGKHKATLAHQLYDAREKTVQQIAASSGRTDREWALGKDGGSDHEGGGVRLTIDTETDTYAQAMAAAEAAYGLPVTPAGWPDAPTADLRPDPQDLGSDDLADGWSDQTLFQMIARADARGAGGAAPDHRTGRHRLIRRCPAALRQRSDRAGPASKDRRAPDEYQGRAAPRQPGSTTSTEP
ncbi:hypothetical protein ACWDSL_47615 [Streptomyces sp. NPDC000941]